MPLFLIFPPGEYIAKNIPDHMWGSCKTEKFGDRPALGFSALMISPDYAGKFRKKF